MATKPNLELPWDPNEPPLTREEGLALLASMQGFLHESYERAGGVQQVIREMRGEDDAEIIP